MANNGDCTLPTGERIVRLRNLTKRIDLGRSAIYERLKNDPGFPRPISLGNGSIGWLESEVDAWIRARIADRDHGGGSRQSSERTDRAMSARAHASQREQRPVAAK